MGESVAKSMLILESRKVIKDALATLKAASENIALLVDKIRNPLAAINGFVEVKVGGEVYEKLHEQVNAINEIVGMLDERWGELDNQVDKIQQSCRILRGT